MNSRNLASITIDVESDWGGRRPSDFSICQGIEEGLPIILRSLENHNFLATFFVSASLAEKKSGLIHLLEKKGHEIASHGYDHDINYSRLSKAQHLYQLQKSKDILEKQAGKQIYGFRSPQFRVHPELFDNLHRTGYLYDSSVANSDLSNRYCFRKHFITKARQCSIREIPITTTTILDIPFGLLWINKFGPKTCNYLLKNLKRKNNLCIMYAHPFDFVLAKKNDIKIPLHIKAWYNWQKYSVENTFNYLMGYMETHCQIETMRKINNSLTDNA